MRIAIVGTGAMGSVYAAILADAGHEVWAIDRWSEHVEAMHEHGLRLEGASGDRTVAVHATTDATDAGVCDLVIIATKALDVEAAAEAVRPLIGADTVVLPIQNGLGSADRIAAVLGEEQVMIGVVGGFGASMVGPGHAHHNGWELVRLGERHAGPHAALQQRAEHLLAQLRSPIGPDAEHPEDRVVHEQLSDGRTAPAGCELLDRERQIDDGSAAPADGARPFRPFRPSCRQPAPAPPIAFEPW